MMAVSASASVNACAWQYEVASKSNETISVILFLINKVLF
jgi:hypothetical protein